MEFKDIYEFIKDILNFKLIDTDKIDFTLGTILFLVISLVLTSILLKLIRIFLTRKLPLQDKFKFISFFKFVRYIVFIFVIIFTLSISGVNVNVLLTASAALMVGLGFALQQLFQDIISGVLIIIDKSLLVGDIVEIDGKVGRVIQIKLRTTRVETRNSRIMIVPNHKFMLDILMNWTQNNPVNRENVSVGVAYGSDVELVKKLLEQCVQSTDGVVKENDVTVLFEDFGDSSLNFSVYFYVENGINSPKIQSDIRFKIDAAFRQNNVTIPFPQRDLHFIEK
ncbi:mechanosensitive ion channel domain-containing protein [uncultured Flavobacterium sp.]|uniref:mechanosensitive ion channel family protein n=1 Tax=uncultured Flavobacterium sp. TaxID=165435 RepID=UPI0030C7AD34